MTDSRSRPFGGLLPACERRGVGIVIGGPFNSGVLARQGGSYDYAAAPRPGRNSRE